MATIIRCTQWDDSPWDDGNTGTTSIAAGDTFTVATIEEGNRVVRLAVLSSNYSAGQIKATEWDDVTWWGDGGTIAQHVTVGQTFTVTSVDLNNRVVWLSG